MAEVLVVDDEQNNRLLLATLIEHSGHTALEAATADEAFHLAATEIPSLIIVDLSLPDSSGADLIARLRKDSKTRRIPIALYTATTITPAIEQLVDVYGLVAVLPKPGSPREVLATLEKIIPRQSTPT